MPGDHAQPPGAWGASAPEPGPAPAAVEVNASYAGEWALFEHYCAATGQSALPAEAATVEGFLTAIPVRPATQARRRRAIVAAHRLAGLPAEHLREDPSGPCGAASAQRGRRREAAGHLMAGCPARGWPTGLAGRRDGFLVVATEVLGHTRERASRLSPDEVTFGSDGVATVADAAVPQDVDPRRCPACAVARWLEVCDLGDGLGQAIARRLLIAAPPTTPDSAHEHLPGHQRWQQVQWLVTGIDQHGRIRDDPITPRAITGRLRDLRARAAQAAAGQGREVGLRAP